VQFPVRACVLIVALGLLPATPAHAWWNCSWTQRAPLAVTAPAPATGAIVEAVLGPAALPGYAWGGADADLRIVDADDLTVLPHYSEPRTGGVQRLRVWFRVPAVGAAPRRVYVYYGNASAGTVSNAALFTTVGVRLLTRRQTGPATGTLAGFLGQFDGASQPAGYGCAVLPDYVGENNATRFGATANVHYSTLFFLDVPSNRTGQYSFRYGADFGYGGGLYVNGQAIEQRWGTDLWWNGSWSSAGQTLEGTVSLPAGRHLVAVYGTEDCCEGLQTLQVRRGNGNWQDLNTANFTLVAPSCPVPGLAQARVDDAGDVDVSQAVETVRDPVRGTAAPKSIPGALKRWTVRVVDGGNARALDVDSIRVVVPVPAGTALHVGDLAPGAGPVAFVDGTPASGLTYAYAGLGSPTDDLDFSRDGAASWGYVPVPGANGTDPNVTHLRVRPRGRPSCSTAASPGSFELRFDTALR
jgi:hypothetical protein